MTVRKTDKYALYESAVQSPEHHAEWFGSVYRELRGRDAHRMREDFCGTARLSVEWVKRHAENTAVGVDLDPEPLAYCTRTHLPLLNAAEKKRVRLVKGDVLKVGGPKVDMVLACNFSFCVIKDRPTLVKYLRGCRRSLRGGGITILDLAGGPGMIVPIREKKTVETRRTGKYHYTWHQKSFDPITHDALYGIDFKLPGGKVRKDVFTYDWRLWTIPEVRDAMKDAGFAETLVDRETEHAGKGTGEYVRLEHGDNAYAWVAYVIGMA